MTIEEYNKSKKILEQQIQELDEKWNEQNSGLYLVNIGRYYERGRTGDIGFISGYCSGKYLCKEVSRDTDGLYVDTVQDWSVKILLEDCEFITKVKFNELLNKMTEGFKLLVSEKFMA